MSSGRGRHVTHLVTYGMLRYRTRYPLTLAIFVRKTDRMNAQVVRTVLRKTNVSGRLLSTSASLRAEGSLDQAQRDRIHPKLGNRDVVGWGFNGTASYVDREEFPMPAVRFKENTPDVMALREKEKGDWKCLTLEEKKALYRASFCQTFAEMKAPTGEWKSILAAIFTGLALTGWITIYMKKCVYGEMPRTITDEWREAQMNKMLAQGQGRVEGLSSKYDFEKGEWK
ncbi:cytochrome c oxidase subunit 4 isoform 1, mitochondrial-like [Babylonia areolata]|uniref:cytochrome c oxidase subunit 4 isoform 1, mitochondrial-like n=1 Tax=Babylonia areolata TaxID=304850 RepID=UPI003FCFE27B